MTHDLYREPAIMSAWCDYVGLDPAQILQDGFRIDHTPDGQGHIATFTRLTGNRHPGEVNIHGPREVQTLQVDVLPAPCPQHPDVRSIVAGRVRLEAVVPAVANDILCEPPGRRTPSVRLSVGYDPGHEDDARAALDAAFSDLLRQMDADTASRARARSEASTA